MNDKLIFKIKINAIINAWKNFFFLEVAGRQSRTRKSTFENSISLNILLLLPFPLFKHSYDPVEQMFDKSFLHHAPHELFFTFSSRQSLWGILCLWIWMNSAKGTTRKPRWHFHKSPFSFLFHFFHSMPFGCVLLCIRNLCKLHPSSTASLTAQHFQCVKI